MDLLKLATTWDPSGRISGGATTIQIGGLLIQGANFDGARLGLLAAVRVEGVWCTGCVLHVRLSGLEVGMAGAATLLSISRLPIDGCPLYSTTWLSLGSSCVALSLSCPLALFNP